MIQIKDLTKRYGDLLALDRLTLQVAPGEIFGLIGPNGAGKTTTLRILATLLRPTSGEVSVGGYSLEKEAAKIRRVIGYVPDFVGVYEDMQVDEYLHFFAAASGITGKKATGVVRDVLELTDLSGKKEALVETLSRGMCQRLGIARVLLHDPQVLILDEPASGLSPRARVEMRMLLKELRSMNKTIIISSHILPELEELCTSIGIIHNGGLRYQGPVKELMARCRSGNVVHVRVGSPAGLASLETLGKIPENKENIGGPQPAPKSAQIAASDSEAKGGEAAEESAPDAGARSGNSTAENPVAVGAELASAETRRAKSLLDTDPRVANTRVSDNLLRVQLTDKEIDPSFIPALLVENGFHLHFFSEEPLTLEDAFLRLSESLTE